LPLDHLALKTLYRIPGYPAGGPSILYALFYRGPPLLRNRPAKNLIDELEPPAAGERLKDTGCLAELTAPSGLLLVPPDHFRTAAERFKVCNFGGMQLHLHAVSCFQPGDGHLDMSLSRTCQQKLFGLGIAVKPQRHVLFEHLVNSLRKLVLVVSGLRLYRKRNGRRWECHRFIGDLSCLVCKRVAGRRLSKFRHCNDVARVGI